MQMHFERPTLKIDCFERFEEYLVLLRNRSCGLPWERFQLTDMEISCVKILTMFQIVYRPVH